MKVLTIVNENYHDRVIDVVGNKMKPGDHKGSCLILLLPMNF